MIMLFFRQNYIGRKKLDKKYLGKFYLNKYYLDKNCIGKFRFSQKIINISSA